MTETAKPHPYFKKMQAGVMINSQAKQVVLNVFFQLSSLSPHKTYKQIGQEAAMLTGVSFNTIFKLKAEKQKSELFGYENKDPAAAKQATPNKGVNNDVLAIDDPNRMNVGGGGDNPNPTPPKKQKREPRPVSPRSMKKKIVVKKRLERYDEQVLTTIRLKFHQYSASKERPSFNEFYKEVHGDPQLPKFSRTTYYCLLKDMGLCKAYIQPKGPPKTGNPGAMGVAPGGVKKGPVKPRNRNPNAAGNGAKGRQKNAVANNNNNNNNNMMKPMTQHQPPPPPPIPQQAQLPQHHTSFSDYQVPQHYTTYKM